MNNICSDDSYCCNCKIPNDIAIGTSPQDAYVRTNLKLKDEVTRVEGLIDNTKVTIRNETEKLSQEIQQACRNIDSDIDIVDRRIDTEVTNMTNRIDNIIANNQDTQGNSELIDIRTGTDGIVHPSAGTAVRNQITDIQKALNHVKPTNQFNRSAVTEDYTIYETGNIVPSEGNFTSDFIPCSGGQVFYFCRKVGNNFYDNEHQATVSHFAQYDSEKKYIGGTRQRFVNAVTLEDNAKYIRFSNPISQLQTEDTILSVTFDFEPTSETVSEWFKDYWTVETDKIKQIETDTKENSSTIKTVKTTSEKNSENIEKIRQLLILAESENKLDLTKITNNTSIDISGNETANDTCFTTDFIKAQMNDTITFSGILKGTFMHKAIKIIRVAMYNDRKEFISASELFVQDYTIQQPDTSFIRVCLPNGAVNYDISAVTINNIPTSVSLSSYFEPYRTFNGISDETKRKRRVLWVGTSIPSYGYPQILGKICGATIINNSIGSSCIAKGVRSRISDMNICGIRNIYGLYGLCQTVNEKQTMINNWESISDELESSDILTDDIKNTALSSSYETIIDPYLKGDNAVSLIVINHAYNDSQNEEDALTIDDIYDTETLEGAYNWLIRHIIQTNPSIGIVIFGHYTDMPDTKETALERVAERWNIPYYKLKNDLGWSNENIKTTKKIGSDGQWAAIPETQMTVKNMWCADNIHPIGTASRRIAQVSKSVFGRWLDMYCSDN